ncbi:MAG: amidohydrolase family protein [Desulfopila sp.]|jgi:imidazolonepropionase-like amidohydrolase|nr:amidohydrolase family protein [Desulfopila sp.]
MAITKYILAGYLIDGSGGAIRKNTCLVVEDGVIADIVQGDHIESRGSDEIEDLRHCTLLPPLVDCSLSLAISGTTDIKERHSAKQSSREKECALVARHIHFCQSHGVLGVVDVNDGKTVRSCLEGVSDNTVAVRTCGSSETAEEGSFDFSRIVSSVDIADASQVEELFSPCLDRSAGLSERNGLRADTVVVANGEACVAEALRQGCGAIEQGYYMGEKNLQQMAAAGVVWIPSMLKVKTALEGTSGAKKVFLQKALAMQHMLMKRGRELGVVTAVGSSSGSSGIIHGESVVEEMKLFMKTGYSLVEALKSASLNGARFFNMEGLGLLQAGMPATFLISRGTVQQLPRKLLYLEGIYIHGLPSKAYRKNPVKTIYPGG